MSKSLDEIAAQIATLSDLEKLRLVDSILEDLDKPDPEIDHAWADEARKRWQAYKEGHASTVPYTVVMAKHRTS